MIRTLGLILTRFFQRFVPDPFVIAVLLLVFTVALALAVGDFQRAGGAAPGMMERVRVLFDAWRGNEGIWKFLAFSMQMCLVLVSGYALACAGMVRRGLDRFAALPQSTAQGAALVAAVACVGGVINWGFGLVVGAILARDVGAALSRRGAPVHYPLLAACGFLGLMVWHGGLSGSAPLTMTSLDAAKKVLPARITDLLVDRGFGGGVPLNETIFSPLNLVVTAGLLVISPLVMALLAPRRADECSAPPAGVLRASVAPATAVRDVSIAERLELSSWINRVIGALLLGAVVRFGIAEDLRRLGINEINALMLGLGMLLHASPRSYAAAAEEGARCCAGIIVQFPLYAGVMAVMERSGLLKQLADGILEIARDNPRWLPHLNVLAGCVINFFVPSGGAQWGVQGPIALEAGLNAGLKPGPMILSVAYGDQITNMLQPFWALPLLAITGAKARDILGYTCIAMCVAAAWIGVVMIVMG